MRSIIAPPLGATRPAVARMMPVPRARHEHARTRRSLKHIVHALPAQRAALLVRPSANLACDLLRLRALHEVVSEWRAGRGSQVGFAGDEQDGDRWPTDGADLFDPL